MHVCIHRYSHLLKKDSPRFHVARTDLDNLVKLVLDSINEYAYEDDRQVVSVKAVKEYCNVGSGSTDVTLTVLEEQEVGWWGLEGKGRDHHLEDTGSIHDGVAAPQEKEGQNSLEDSQQ